VFFKRLKFFTLVELLVVIAIISVLASMLLPALGRARDMAEGYTCLNNTKQLGMVNQFYSNDYSGYLIPAYRVNGYADSNGVRTWYVYIDLYNEVPPLLDISRRDTFLYCASQEMDVGGGLYGAGYSWNKNSGYYTDASAALSEWNCEQPKITQIVSPGKYLILIDAVFSSDKSSLMYWANEDNAPASGSDLTSNLHLEGDSVSYGDGHSEIVSYGGIQAEIFDVYGGGGANCWIE
jgi:prepilin-type N-terminal cleavage/methylation domain-containing protein